MLSALRMWDSTQELDAQCREDTVHALLAGRCCCLLLLQLLPELIELQLHNNTRQQNTRQQNTLPAKQQQCK
jgi:hypothetical protein